MREREPDDLPLDELRRAWRGLEPELPAEDLSEVDPTTRASVEWMHAAWSSLQVPAVRVPSRRLVHPVLRLAAGLAAAAAVLASLWLAGNQGRLQRSEDFARSESEAPIAPNHLEGPQLASLSSEHVELRSGPVRLVLLTDQRPQ
jgi:hypothetical protein